MRKTAIALVLIVCFSCKEKQETLTKKQESVTRKIVKSEFQTLIDSANVIGSILIYDLTKDTYYSNGFEWASEGKLPASTFKIVNSIIGLETGIVESDSTIFKWNGQKKYLKSWEKDLVLKDAFQFSCVPCYQDLARKIGVNKMNSYVKKLNYGNLKVDSLTIDNFWLTGVSRISQMQQIDFLKRFNNSELPITERTKNIMKDIMLIRNTGHYILSGKSGLSNENQVYNGWYVGYIEVNNNTYLFATNIEPKSEFDLNSFVKKRLDLTLSAFQKINVLLKN